MLQYLIEALVSAAPQRPQHTAPGRKCRQIALNLFRYRNMSELEFRFLVGDNMDEGGEASGFSAESCGGEEWDTEDVEDKEFDEDDT
mmetsp:Transcript_11467/g.29018  ORF Transcript_11467/g.29018 Transcript_11467/m.29018 type:complete len:87 (-) Transcript_11467:189-449(-)